MKTILIALLFTITAVGTAFAQGTPSPEGARVYFVNLSDGDAVSSPVKVVFGLSGMGVAPAGIALKNTGHHHLLVNRAPMGEGDSGELSAPIPADDTHLHFGGGQTETTVELPAGTHTLQLVVGDHLHIPHSAPVMSEVITITVQ